MDLPWPTFFRNGRIGAGSYSLYQSASDPSYYWRNGLLVQLRTELLINYFYFQYEHHEYKSKNSISEANGTTSNSWNSENRYGVIFSFYETFKKDFFVDTYFESFLIPEVSKNDLLSVLRLTLVYKHFIEPVNPLAEIYLKESPFVFGGQVREIRLGLQWYPTDYASIKLTGNCLPTSAVSSAGILLQLDIFKEGQL